MSVATVTAVFDHNARGAQPSNRQPALGVPVRPHRTSPSLVDGRAVFFLVGAALATPRGPTLDFALAPKKSSLGIPIDADGGIAGTEHERDTQDSKPFHAEHQSMEEKGQKSKISANPDSQATGPHAEAVNLRSESPMDPTPSWESSCAALRGYPPGCGPRTGFDTTCGRPEPRTRARNRLRSPRGRLRRPS